MASRISQMRNAVPQLQPQQQPQLPINEVRGLMQMVKNSQNPQAMLAQILQSNPNTAAISGMLRNDNSLESIAREMAQARGIDINQLIQQLQGGT